MEAVTYRPVAHHAMEGVMETFRTMPHLPLYLGKGRPE
jgi:hypothetical protein